MLTSVASKEVQNINSDGSGYPEPN